MAQRGRPGLSPDQKRELWRRWKAGESLSERIRASPRPPGGLDPRRGGGQRRNVPAGPRRRSSRVLSLDGGSGGDEPWPRRRSVPPWAIARRTRRAPSTISRATATVAVPGTERSWAEDRAWQWARRPKPCKLVEVHRSGFGASSPPSSPSSGRPSRSRAGLPGRTRASTSFQVSTETTYRSLLIQARGVLRKELTAHLRSRRTMRRSKHATRKGQGRGGVPLDAVSIRERPAEVEDRAVPGHWEGDRRPAPRTPTSPPSSSARPATCCWSGSPARTPPPSSMRSPLRSERCPPSSGTSLTWDRGMELAEHIRFSVATDAAVYFCDPQRAPGSEVRTRTPTACSASTSRVYSPLNPQPGRDRRRRGEAQPGAGPNTPSTALPRLCSPRLSRRPLECAGISLQLAIASLATGSAGRRCRR